VKILPLIVLPFVTALFVTTASAASQDPPTLNVNPSCHAAADGEGSGGAVRLKGCLESEQKSREALVQQWTKFPASDRDICVKAATLGGDPTYTELITCLEMERDAKQNPADHAAIPGVPAASAEPAGVGLKSAVERAHGH
jgi:hypothetical protein